MNISETQMNGILGEMTRAGEECLCPVYCMFLKTGFFAHSYSLTIGYISYTSDDRLICAKNTLGSWTGAAYRMTDLRRIKIKKTLFGQYRVYAEFADAANVTKTVRIKFQLALKVIGCDLPDQERNGEILLDTLKRYEDR